MDQYFLHKSSSPDDKTNQVTNHLWKQATEMKTITVFFLFAKKKKLMAC